jgi:hypothetical protein
LGAKPSRLPQKTFRFSLRYLNKNSCFLSLARFSLFFEILIQVFLGEPLRALCALASGYPLHHPLARSALAGGSASIPLACALRRDRACPVSAFRLYINAKEVASNAKEVDSSAKEVDSNKKEADSNKKEADSNKKEVASNKKEAFSCAKEVASNKKEVASNELADRIFATNSFFGLLI